MKLTSIVLLIGFFHVSASTLSQTLTLRKHSMSMRDLALEIRKQTGFVVSGSSKILENTNALSVNVRNIPLEEFLDQTFKGRSVSYRIEGKNIILTQSLAKPVGKSVQLMIQQNIDVRGALTDSLGKPISGASIVIVGTNRGTSSDNQGEFFLANVSRDANLRFSSVGYADRIAKVQGNMTIMLTATTDGIDQVIINTGYQQITQERATGAITTITAEQLDSRFAPNILDNLEGRVAGLVTYGDQIMVRGTGTLVAESKPLLVLDGLPVEIGYEDLNPYDIETVTILKDAAASAIYGARASNGVIIVTTKRAKELNKIDVEVSSNTTIWEKRNVDYADNWYMTPEQQVNRENDYFKWLFNDAPNAAANVTGVRDAIQGVGSFDLNPTPIQYDHYLLATGSIDQTELENRLAFYRTQNFAKDYANTFLRNRILQMHNASIRHRSDKYQSNLIVNFTGDNTGTIHDSNKQLNLFYKGSYDMTKWLTVNFGVNNILNNATQRRSNYVENIMDPFGVPGYYSLFNSDGSPADISPGWTHYYTPYSEWAENNSALRPMHYHLAEEINLNKHQIERLNTRLQGELLFKVMKGLTVNTQYVYEKNRQSVSNYSEPDSYLMRLMRNVYTVQNPNGTYRYMIPQNGGRLASENQMGDFWTARGQVNYSTTLHNVHQLDLIAGLEFRETNSRGNRNLYLGWDDQLQSHASMNVNYNDLWNLVNTSYYAQGYPARQFLYTPFIENAMRLNVPGNNLTEVRRRFASTYANLTYTYDRRYNIFGSLRKDFADVYGLATEFRGSPFGSVGLSWNLHNEAFMRNFPLINMLKLRGSYGYTGNIYQSATSFMTANTGLVNTYTGLPRASIESPGNPELSWEKTGTTNIGAEFMLYDSRLRGVVDWYFKKSEQVFSNQTIESTKGFTSLVMNMANLENKGLELTLAYDWFRPRDRGDFLWTTSGTASWNKNEVTRVQVQANTAVSAITVGYREGLPVRSLLSYRFAGLTEQGAQSWYDEEGRIVPDVTIARSTPGSVYYIGQADPKHTYAMENQFAWKGFSLNVLMVYYGGHHLRANQYQINPFSSSLPLNSWYLDAWTPDNTDTQVPGIWEHNVSVSTNPSVQNNTDIFVHRADFLKIRNLVFGYAVPHSPLSKIGLNNLRLRFQVDNLPAIWKSNDIGVDPETLGLRLPTGYVLGVNFSF